MTDLQAALGVSFPLSLPMFPYSFWPWAPLVPPQSAASPLRRLPLGCWKNPFSFFQLIMLQPLSGENGWRGHQRMPLEIFGRFRFFFLRSRGRMVSAVPTPQPEAESYLLPPASHSSQQQLLSLPLNWLCWKRWQCWANPALLVWGMIQGIIKEKLFLLCERYNNRGKCQL